MIRRCGPDDFDTILAVINDAARAYRSVIPEDRYLDPYMSAPELRHEIEDGVRFRGATRDGELIAVMGIQDVEDVTLIRHAYVRTAHRRQGIGGRLLTHLQSSLSRPLLVGTWAAADWAIQFYRRHGFRPVADDQAPILLRRYWSVPERQIETSIVLADKTWFERTDGPRGPRAAGRGSPESPD